MGERIEITVDGRPVEVAGDGMLLAALRGAGVEVPTLCDHPSLEPSGACRLCVVEVTHPGWGGWQGLVTACLYPVEPGLVVFTRSERVRQVRRGLLELYLAECPQSEVVRALARSDGVDATPFHPKEAPDLCVRCGLCIRVCQELGPAAIAPLGRGTEKRVGPRPDLFGEDCTGCRACAHVCPTGEIQIEQQGGRMTIWNRAFEIPVCAVEADACRGCGVCEEVCPFSIPRVTLQRSGSPSARISEATCVGCGICAGACPTGAIRQRDGDPGLATAVRGALDPVDRDLRDRLVVFACSRSPLPAATGDHVEHVPVSCIGRVPVDSMLDCLARGAGAVLAMCRDQASCPYGSGGALGERHVAVAEELAAAAGLGPARVRYVVPGAGLAAPAAAVAAHRRITPPTPLRAVQSGGEQGAGGAPDAGLDRALAIMEWLGRRPELTPELPRSWLEAAASPMGAGETAAPWPPDLHALDLLLTLVVPDWRLRDALRGAVSPPAATGGDAFRFRITPAERLALVESLRRGEAARRSTSPYALAQLELLLRPGAWIEVPRGEPVSSGAGVPDGVGPPAEAPARCAPQQGGDAP